MQPNQDLTECDTCGNLLAKSATQCPHCGARYTSKPLVALLVLLGIIGLLLVAVKYHAESAAIDRAADQLRRLQAQP